MDFKIKTLAELKAEKRQAAVERAPVSTETGRIPSGASDENNKGCDRVKKVVLVRRKISHDSKPALDQSKSVQGGVKRQMQEVGPQAGSKWLKLGHHNIIVNGEMRRGQLQEGGAVMKTDVRTMSTSVTVSQAPSSGGKESEEGGVNSSTSTMNPISPSFDDGPGEEKGWSQQRKRSIAEIKTEM